MAKQMRRGLSGSPRKHASLIAHERASMEHNMGFAERNLARGSCSAAYKYLEDASYKYGAMDENEKHAGGVAAVMRTGYYGSIADAEEAKKRFRKLSRAFKAKCIVKKAPKLKGRGSTIRGRF